ncbi:uncharacterized protein ATC70_004208 [Mucor velutinosus]|uniref:Centrosomin N-terminal motif 1 domain-containing protein n=1 Tax=Mucor velutinosus TaxID=708070 RepID=A0AAN7I4Z3_9FUNG|nr:hypothetical protein ATC70_004208 [Mucor velutinosus]
MNRFDDEMSTTNVSLIDDVHTSRPLMTSPLSISSKKPAVERQQAAKSPTLKPKDYLRNGSLALKHQENTMDGLKKENFDLRLSLYFYEQRLNDMSSDSIDQALKENVSLKVTIQKLTQELKKYKNIILELNQGLDILKNQPCTKQHGMTEQEREEFEKVKSDADQCHDENDNLSRLLAEVTSENVRLRSTIRSRNTSSTTDISSSNNSTSSSSNEDYQELSRKYRQAKLKIEEQQRIIQQSSRYNNNHSNQTDDHLIKSMLSERDAVIAKNTKLNRQLENELQLEKERGDAMALDLQEKKKQIHSLKLELDQYNHNLHETKQQLRNKAIECDQLLEENEDLRVNNENMGTLIDNFRRLEDENDELANEIQDREQEIEALEAEVVKLLSHLENKENERGRDTQEADERILQLEEEINMLKNELKSVNESHDNDIEAFEDHVSKTQDEIKKKDQEIKSVLLELEESKRECEELLEKQYNELIVTIRDREVRMATLEGNFEQKTDTMQREKELLREEMEELQDRVRELEEQLQQNHSTPQDNEYQQTLEAKMKDTKREQRKATEQLAKQTEQVRLLKQKLISSTKKNALLNSLLDQNKKSEHNDRAADKHILLSKLNQELRQELEDRDRHLDMEKKKCQEQDEIIQQLKKQLERRETMLTNSLLARDTLKEQGEFMENILYEQATGGHSFRDRADSAMSSF